jgi:hypothetical protein
MKSLKNSSAYFLKGREQASEVCVVSAFEPVDRFYET